MVNCRGMRYHEYPPTPTRPTPPTLPPTIYSIQNEQVFDDMASLAYDKVLIDMGKEVSD